MDWKEGNIDGVVVEAATKRTDERGWLAEMYRSDEVPTDLMPVMSYVSVSKPHITRGPHEHIEQTDRFGFVGPGNFRIVLWDNRKESPTYGLKMTITAGEDNPMILTVPPCVVHGYTNISDTDAWVLNFPNRLFAGEGRKEPVDEIRHENTDPDEFTM